MQSSASHITELTDLQIDNFSLTERAIAPEHVPITHNAPIHLTLITRTAEDYSNFLQQTHQDSGSHPTPLSILFHKRKSIEKIPC